MRQSDNPSQYNEFSSWRGAWSSSATYDKGEAVSYNGSSWVCLQYDVTGVAPGTDPTKWGLLAAKGDMGAAGPPGPQGPQGPAGVGVPAGGTTKQSLRKLSNTDYDTAWQDVAHADLTGVTADQHHAQVHGLADHQEGSARISAGLESSRPAAGTAGRLYFATDTLKLFRDTGTAWEVVSVQKLAELSERAHSSLTGVTADQHHAKNHNLWSADHPDVDTADVRNDGDVLTWDATAAKWKASPPPPGGGGGGTPSDTVQSETSFGQSPAAGTATTYSRGDHTHGTPAHTKAIHDSLLIDADTVDGKHAADLVANAGGTPSIQQGALASRPAAGTAGRLYIATDAGEVHIFRDTGTAWEEVDYSDAEHGHSHASLSGIGPDDHHAKAHAHDGVDGSGTVSHASLGGVTADQHHSKAHAHDGVDGSGTVSHAALTGVTADQHHPQVHGLADHDEGSARISAGLEASRPAAGTAGRLYFATDTLRLFRDTGTAWELVSVQKLAELAERAHASLTGIGADDHHAKLHTVTDTLHHGFPGGTSNFLRADGTWAVPSGSPWTELVTTADVSKTGTGAYVQVTELSFSVTSGEKVWVEGELIVSKSNAGDVLIRFLVPQNSPSGQTCLGWFLVPDDVSPYFLFTAKAINSTTSPAYWPDNSGQAVYVPVNNGIVLFYFRLQLIANTNGSFTPEIAPPGAGITSYVKTGSRVRYRKVA